MNFSIIVKRRQRDLPVDVLRLFVNYRNWFISYTQMLLHSYTTYPYQRTLIYQRFLPSNYNIIALLDRSNSCYDTHNRKAVCCLNTLQCKRQ